MVDALARDHTCGGHKSYNREVRKVCCVCNGAAATDGPGAVMRGEAAESPRLIPPVLTDYVLFIIMFQNRAILKLSSAQTFV